MMEPLWITAGEGRYTATGTTSGPWSAEHQHGGPAAALLARAIEQLPAAPGLRVARITYELLGAIPVAGTFEVAAEIARDGRRVQHATATLALDGRTLVRAGAWRVRAGDHGAATAVHRPPPLPATGPDADPPDHWRFPYFLANEWRSVAGRTYEPGPATVWTRLSVPVVDDEEPTGLQRAVAAADSANGVSSALDFRTWRFIPPELTVHLLRDPVGPWICIDAETILAAGAGLCEARLFDGDGLVGRSAQALLVEPV
jgi:hypothetical protein